MKRVKWSIAVAALLVVAVVAVQARAATSCTAADAFCFKASADATPKLLERVTLPEIAVPIWMGSSE